MAATLYGPMPAPNGLGDPAWYSSSQYNSGQPYISGDWYICFAQADPAPQSLRRSEIKIGASQAAVQTACGKTTKWSGYIQPHLGGAKNDGRSWHCVLQLHGPDYDGQWRGAQPTIMIRNGMWRLEHGLSLWDPVDLMPYVDGATVFVTVEATMSEKLELGTITVTLTPDGGSTQSWSVQRETWAHQWSVWHSGLYRGSGSSTLQPTYGQFVYLKDCHVVTSWPVFTP